MVKFLVVDDDRLCRELVRVPLTKLGRCDLAFDGREAVAAFRIALDADERYDLVCLDLMMPGMDGHATLEAIREIERARGIAGSDGVQVVMLTGTDSSKDCIRAFKEGCESFLSKPIERRALLAAVRELLPGRLPEADRPRCLVVDDDATCRAVLRDFLLPHLACDCATNGREAIKAVRSSLGDDMPYDLVCLDILMPDMDGHDTLATLRALEAEHGVVASDGAKVVMTTGLHDSKHCIQSFREGCECYVTKPVTKEELLAKLETLGLVGEAEPVSGGS